MNHLPLLFSSILSGAANLSGDSNTSDLIRSLLSPKYRFEPTTTPIKTFEYDLSKVVTTSPIKVTMRPLTSVALYRHNHSIESVTCQSKDLKPIILELSRPNPHPHTPLEGSARVAQGRHDLSIESVITPIKVSDAPTTHPHAATSRCSCFMYQHLSVHNACHVSSKQSATSVLAPNIHVSNNNKSSAMSSSDMSSITSALFPCHQYMPLLTLTII
jgi:hypothetical protein